MRSRSRFQRPITFLSGPRNWLRIHFFGTRKKEQILVPFGHFKSTLEPYATADYSLAPYKLQAPKTPDELRARVRALKATGIAGEGISVDQVFNEEIVEKFKKG